MSGREPAQVYCLGEHLSDELMARGWTTEDVAARMGGSHKQIATNLLMIDLLICIQDDNLIIDDGLFDDLSDVFGVSSSYFRNLDAAWRRFPDRRSQFTPPEDIFGPLSRQAIAWANQ